VGDSQLTDGRIASAGGRIWIWRLSATGSGTTGASGAAIGSGSVIAAAGAAGVSIVAGSAAGAFSGSGLANGFLYSLAGVMTSRAMGL
jgi:hypothetical protein